EVLRCLAAELKAQKAPTFFRVAAPGSLERTMCKRAAVTAKSTAKAATEASWELDIPHEMALPGLSLLGNRQKVFYRSIREEKAKKVTLRPSTIKKLEVVRQAVEAAFCKRASDTDIWLSVEKDGILPRPGQFLWKGIHNTHRIGAYWTHIPECEDRAICTHCGVLEYLEHILVKCESPGQQIIWKAAKTLWLEKAPQWPEISIGTILGCGLAAFRDGSKVDRGAEWLYRILISESAVIW
ncbi:hypothetical protein B0H10DRAFT_1716470, partial [Mycena sp. CBHHK59/15]